ncbi:hypothetical protein C8R44DRAFT_777082 [Mycena epipterygia]|nr:hypothetical protein C8R44DRAFT_777082 [Mycena epipterygia]
MEYTPRYTQPFTLSEARLLDVETITEEIARLQNSLHRLGDTQEMLREHIASIQPGEDVDPEITKAIEENETVMYACSNAAARCPFSSSFVRCSGSQSERVSILKMALADKGIVAGDHYDFTPPFSRAQVVAGATPAGAHPPVEEDGGVDL